MHYIEELQAVIRKLHGCGSSYLETVPVKESFQGKVVWEGDVEVFELQDHPQAKRCYAWGHLEGKQDKDKRYFAVLHVPPVDTPQKAVQAAIVSQSKNKK